MLVKVKLGENLLLSEVETYSSVFMLRFRLRPGFGMEGKHCPDGGFGESGADPSASGCPGLTDLCSSIHRFQTCCFQRKDSPVGALTLSLEPLGGDRGEHGHAKQERASGKRKKIQSCFFSFSVQIQDSKSWFKYLLQLILTHICNQI